MPPEVSGTPSAPAAPATQPAAVATPPAAGASPSWYGELPDPELKGWVELKGWKTPADALKSAREAEKLIGAPPGEMLRMPKADAPQAEWDAYYTKAGRPATPDDYKLEVPMGDDGAFAKAIAPILHKAGITGTQAKMLNEAWNQLMAGTLETANAQAGQQSQADILNLKREWGSSYDARLELGRRAVRQFGAELGDTPEECQTELLKLENYLGGSAKMIKLFAAIGSGLGESKFHDGDRAPGFEGMTPAAAIARLAELHADKDWAKARLSNGKESPQAREEDALQRIAVSGQH